MGQLRAKTAAYIDANKIEDNLAYVLTDYARGYKQLYEICSFYGVNIDTAVYHINQIK